MHTRMVSCVSWLPYLAVAVTALLLFPFLLKPGKSQCAMTYMYPSYFDVSSMAGADNTYQLYLYREGRSFYIDARKVQSILLYDFMLRHDLHP